MNTPEQYAENRRVTRIVDVLLTFRGWDKKDLARAMGVSGPTLTKKSTGNGSSWSVADIDKMSKAFGVPLNANEPPPGEGWGLRTQVSVEVSRGC